MNAGRVLYAVVYWAWPVLSVVLSYIGIPYLIWHGVLTRLRRYRIVEVKPCIQ